MTIPRVLSIAGSDSGGGAGIQADLKTFFRFNTYGMTAMTALTAQNTVGVQDVYPVSDAFVAAQIDSVAEDIGFDAAKTGMLGDAAIVAVVAERINHWGIHPLVVDPVMVAKSGDRLLQKEAIEVMMKQLLPRTTIVTPNIHEAEIMLHDSIATVRDMEAAAEAFLQLGCQAVVIKGGHLGGETSVDVYRDATRSKRLCDRRIRTLNTHGTGCTFASAIAAGLAHGWDPLKAVGTAKRYVTRAIRYSLDLGEGHGPTNHWASFDTCEGNDTS